MGNAFLPKICFHSQEKVMKFVIKQLCAISQKRICLSSILILPLGEMPPVDNLGFLCMLCMYVYLQQRTESALWKSIIPSTLK